MRRDPQAILIAHIMDPTRRSLYVEGSSDRTFIRWIVGERMNQNAMVLTIDTVELPDQTRGGARARLITFAALVEGKTDMIKFLADADTDRICGRTNPDNVWLTDRRDLEGYIFTEQCFNKVLILGLEKESINGQQLLSQIHGIARELAILRLVSDEDELDLPFQNTDLSRSLRCSKGRFDIHVDMDRYISTLLQKAGISIRQLPRIKERMRERSSELSELPDHELTHGKDAICLLQKVLSELGVQKDDAAPILRTSFERIYVSAHPILAQVVDFLIAA